MITSDINQSLFEFLKSQQNKIFKNIFIVNEDKRLIGVISQGDLLNHFKLGGTSNVQLVDLINFNPTCIINLQGNSNILKEKFLKYKVTEIPILDENYEIIKIKSIFELLEEIN